MATVVPVITIKPASRFTLFESDYDLRPVRLCCSWEFAAQVAIKTIAGVKLQAVKNSPFGRQCNELQCVHGIAIAGATALRDDNQLLVGLVDGIHVVTRKNTFCIAALMPRQTKYHVVSRVLPLLPRQRPQHYI
jgi:hypothetical protein